NEKIDVLAKEIHERKQAEEALQQSNRRIANILDSITDGFTALDRQWRLTYINRQAEEFFLKLQERPGDLVGKNIWDEFPDLVGSKLYDEYHRALSTQTPVSFEIIYPKLGIWHEVHAYPSADGLSVYSHDITSRKEAEANLQNQQKWLEAVLNLMPAPMLLIEPGTARVTFANRAADVMAGGDFPKGKSAEEYHTVYYCTDSEGKRIPDHQMPGVRVARGERLDSFQMDWHTPAGQISLLLFADVLPAMYGHPATAVVLFQDISNIKKITAELKQNSRLKDEFLATVSHELRTPLNAILGWARMLRTGRLDEENRSRAVETIERNARLQAQLIEDLLDVSRIITGKLRLNAQPVTLVTVVEAAIDSLRPSIEAKGLRLEVTLDPRAGPVSGDPDRLQQVLWNILSNAVKFTPKSGRIQVRLERINSHTEITVSDTGKGITPEFLPFVFDRFSQADGSMTRLQGGLGLGLAIVRHLVELHGGSVHAYSPGEGLGATFTVRLPLMIVQDSERFPREAAQRRHPTAGHDVSFECSAMLDGLKVLVVEDEPDARELLVAVLGQCGAVVTAVASAAEGLAYIEESKPDVIVSDIEMPGEDGYSFIRKVRSLESRSGGRTLAAALTAYARVEDRLRALSAGFDTHVAKPVEPAEIVAVVASLAGRRINHP
ncbi:MAG TPA: ATP-binding protein, partial [Blastocatellia bacterium]|nr:ATP-binding protein [Blastocatellia bacterium]